MRRLFCSVTAASLTWFVLAGCDPTKKAPPPPPTPKTTASAPAG